MDLAAGSIADLVSTLIAHARNVFSFTSIAKEFEEEMTCLKERRIRIEHLIDDTIKQNHDIAIEYDVRTWLEKADRIIQEEEDTITKQTCFFGFCPNCMWRYRRGRKLANNTNKIQQLIERGYFDSVGYRVTSFPDVVLYSSQYYVSFKSRESEYKELLDALKDDNNYITGLQGMGGTGKTTLANEVGRELKQEQYFTHVIHTTVSFTPDIKKIQHDIAGSLGLRLENSIDSERAIRLRRRLTNGEKILLIVDDVWDQNQLNFDAIGIPNRDDHNGCRVLVITCCKRILHKMNCDKIIELNLLTEEDAWIMFERYAGINNSSSKSVIAKGREIAKECKQLPIAIAVIAHSCKGHQDRIHEWDVTLKSLKNRVSMHDVDDDMVQIYKALKFSYDYIKDEKAKRLFLLCSLFQENEEIPIEVLTRFIIGAGLFGDNYDSYDDARNKVVVAKNKLLDSCLLLEVSEKHVKMHDLVRAMAQWIANKEIQGVNLSKTKQKLLVERETNIKYLSCEGKDMDLFSCKFDGSNLETLIVKVDRDEDSKCMEVPNSFFETIVKLRVLYFLGNDKRQLSLPRSIHSLTNIRSMLVDSVDLGDISILGNLQSLETLDLVQCKINEFPREIAKLEKFTLLKMEYCEIRENNPFEVIEKCSSLEELYFIDSFNGFCQEINFPELPIYHIRKGRAVMDDSLSKYVVFPSNDDACCFSNAKLLKYCMQTAEVLQLNGIKGEWRNLMPEMVPIHLGIDDLVELRLSCISQLQCLIDTDGSQVPIPTVLFKLVVLELDRMENLKELFKGTLSLDSMKNLEKLSINDCKHLKSLFRCKLNLCNLKTIKLQSCPMLVSLDQLLTSRNLVLLEELKIGHCEKLKNIIADERREEESIEEIEDSENNKCVGSMFPKLKVLDIEGCHLLETIFPFLFVHDLPVLETIKVRRCDGLKYIFGQYQDAEFGSLRQLELSQLPNFIDMFCKSNHPISLSKKGSSSTSNYGSKAQLQLDSSGDTATTTIPLVDGEDYSEKEADNPEFRREESNSHCLNNKCVGSLFPKLEVFDIEGCPLLESIFPFLFVQDLPVLETIRIRKCGGLKYIFGQYQHEEFDSLRQLELSQLPNFIDMFRKSKYEKGSSSTFNSDSKAQLQLDLDPMKCNIFSGDTTTITTIPLVDGDYSESNSYYLNIWNQAQCLQIPSKILYNIKKIELSHFSKIKSVFIPSIAPKMLLETLTIRNCDELKNIIDFGDYDSGSNTWCNVFPKMKELYIEGCPKMKYIFGHYTDDNQNHMEIQLQLLELKCLSLCNLPILVAMCPKHYRIIFPPLVKLELNKCSEAAIKSMSHVRIHPVSESLDSTVIKDYVDIEGSQETTEINNQGSLNDGSFMKVSSNIKEQIPKEDDVRVSKSRLSSIASQLPSKDFPDATEFQTTSEHELSSSHENGIVSNNYEIVKTEMNATTEGKQEFVVNIPGLVIKMKQRENSEIIVETKMKQTAEANQEFVVNVSGLEILEVANSQTNSQDDDWYGQITIPSQMAMIEPLATQNVVDDEDWDETDYASKLEMLRQFNYDLRNGRDLETTEDVAAEVEVQATSGHMLQLCLPFQCDCCCVAAAIVVAWDFLSSHFI